MNRRVLLAALTTFILCACDLSSPVTPTPTDTPILPTVTAHSTVTPMPTRTATPVQLVVHVTDELVNCRLGPSVLYELVNELRQGQSARALGRNDTSTWWYVRDPGNPNGYCWLSGDVTEIDGDGNTLPVVHSPVTKVTEITLVVEPNRLVVVCTQFPQTFFFEAEITVNGPTSVNWQWEASTGALSDVGMIAFNESGTKVINEFYQIGGPNDYWVKLHILAPNVLTEQANFRVSCTP